MLHLADQRMSRVVDSLCDEVQFDLAAACVLAPVTLARSPTTLIESQRRQGRTREIFPCFADVGRPPQRDVSPDRLEVHRFESRPIGLDEPVSRAYVTAT